MQIYLAAAPDKLREATRYTDRLAHAAYRIGGDGRLVRRDLLARTRGGLMILGDRDCGYIRDPGILCRDVWRECGNRGYGGVVADLEQPETANMTSFLSALGQVLSRNGKRLFVPERYGAKIPQASVLICTALSGGNLRQRLEEVIRQFGRGRIALDLQRLQMSFPLPCPSGEGEPLSRMELEALMGKKQQSVFYSHDLCAKYFTDTDENGSRFVLFDDADTMRRKLHLGQELGIASAFLMFPEVEDLLPELFRKS